jgi:hypothetical protein
MVGLGIGAFAWVDRWWATALLLATALGVGWYSLGLFARASTAAAHRALHGLASTEDDELLRGLGGRARNEAFRAASYDPQRDRIYDEFVAMLGGEEGALDMIFEHAEANGQLIEEDEARALLTLWHYDGIVKNLSLGELLDAAWAKDESA